MQIEVDCAWLMAIHGCQRATTTSGLGRAGRGVKGWGLFLPRISAHGVLFLCCGCAQPAARQYWYVWYTTRVRVLGRGRGRGDEEMTHVRDELHLLCAATEVVGT